MLHKPLDDEDKAKKNPSDVSHIYCLMHLYILPLNISLKWKNFGVFPILNRPQYFTEPG